MITGAFSADEAVRLLGKEVVCRETREGRPVGTSGRVVRVRGEGGARVGFSVTVQWQCPGGRVASEFTKPEFERSWTIPQHAEYSPAVISGVGYPQPGTVIQRRVRTALDPRRTR